MSAAILLYVVFCVSLLYLPCSVVTKAVVFCSDDIPGICPEDEYCEPGYGYCMPCDFICEGVEAEQEQECRRFCYCK